jgi:hypothetical protein
MNAMVLLMAAQTIYSAVGGDGGRVLQSNAVRLHVVPPTSKLKEGKEMAARHLLGSYPAEDSPKGVKAKVVLVNDRNDADVVLEILKYEEELIPQFTARVPKVTAKLTAKGQELELIGYADRINTWMNATLNLKEQLDNFIKRNRAHLINSR